LADVLSQSEVDALLAAVNEPRARAESGPADVRYYDFLRPERVSSTEMRALTDLHEAAARTIAAALGGALVTTVGCRLQAFDQVTWAEFALGMPNPTCFAVVLAKPSGGGEPFGSAAFHGGRLALEIGPAVMHPMLECLLGASPGMGNEPPARPLTAIERRVAGGLVEVVLGALSGAWGRVADVEFVAEQIETNPQVVAAVPPAEMAAIATFELSIGPGDTAAASGGDGRAGLIHLCMPFSIFGPLFASLAARSAATEGGVAPGKAGANAASRAALMRVPVHVEAHLAWTRMTLREIAALRSGDTIATGRSTEDAVIVTVAGEPKFASTAGEFRGRKAVLVSGRLGRPSTGPGPGGGGAR
jgi:flagellar motor switch protein FliM